MIGYTPALNFYHGIIFSSPLFGSSSLHPFSLPVEDFCSLQIGSRASRRGWRWRRWAGRWTWRWRRSSWPGRGTWKGGSWRRSTGWRCRCGPRDHSTTLGCRQSPYGCSSGRRRAPHRGARRCSCAPRRACQGACLGEAWMRGRRAARARRGTPSRQCPRPWRRTAGAGRPWWRGTARRPVGHASSYAGRPGWGLVCPTYYAFSENEGRDSLKRVWKHSIKDVTALSNQLCRDEGIKADKMTFVLPENTKASRGSLQRPQKKSPWSKYQEDHERPNNLTEKKLWRGVSRHATASLPPRGSRRNPKRPRNLGRFCAAGN